jgi:ribosomal protein L11 methyltransferase
MAGYKAQVRLPEQQAERLAGLYAQLLDPTPAVSSSETPDGWLLELYFDAEPPLAELRQVAAEYIGSPVAEAITVEPLPDEDWVAVTQRGLHPIRAGRFLIHGSHDRERAKDEPYAIEIEAGQAFGTAHHGTTRGCLVMIDRLAKRGGVSRVLDLGTGSAVLAIAAAKCLSHRVLATDIDPVAVRVARENCERNGAKGRVRLQVAAGLSHPAIRCAAPFGVVTANILAKPLIQLAPAIRHAVADGGHLILSGLLDSQAREVTARYKALGFTLASRLFLDGWATLHLRG